MNLNDTRQLLRHLYTASQETDPRYFPLLLWGESGVGKTENVEQVARELGIGCTALLLGQMEPGDVLGLPREHVREDGVRVTKHLTPNWWPKEGTKGILFLDEINRAHRESRQAIFQLLLGRRIHEHALPEGWIIIGAANPPTDAYEVEDTYDKAWLARFIHVACEPTADEWLQYASETGAYPSVIQTISRHKQILGKLSCQIPQIKPTPRSWSLLSKIAPGLPGNLMEEVAVGCVGTEGSSLWLSLVRDSVRPLSAEEVFDRFDDPEVQRMYKAILGRGITECRVDALYVTFGEIWRLCRDPKEFQPNKKQMNNFAKILFSEGIPHDFTYNWLKNRFFAQYGQIEAHHPFLEKLGDIDGLEEMILKINAELGIGLN